MEKKEFEKEYRKTKSGKKSYRNMTIVGIIWLISLVACFIFVNNDKISNLVFLIEDLLLMVTLCFDFYYLGGLKEFKNNYNKKN